MRGHSRGHSLLLAALATASLSLATEALVGRAQHLGANGGVMELLLSPESSQLDPAHAHLVEVPAGADVSPTA